MNQQRVYAGIDNSPLNRSVADYAAWIAVSVNTSLTFLNNIEHNELLAVSDLSGSIGLGSREHLLGELIELEARRNKLLIEQGKELLDSAQQSAIDNGVESCEKLQRHGPLSETLIELEDKMRVLVLGARGEDHSASNSNNENSREGLGRQIESIIRSLHKPILIVNKPFTIPKSLLLAYDGSEASNKALKWLTTSPLYKNMTCHLAHVCDDEKKGNEVLNTAMEKLASANVIARGMVLSGDTQTELLNYQQQHNIDLIVMGSFGHSRLREMVLGSLTLKMLAKAKIPLLLLR